MVPKLPRLTEPKNDLYQKMLPCSQEISGATPMAALFFLRCLADFCPQQEGYHGPGRLASIKKKGHRGECSMFKKEKPYKGNKKIMDDNQSYPDKNTIALIDLIAEIVVGATLAHTPKPQDDCPRQKHKKGDQ